MHRNPMFFHSKCPRGVCQGDCQAPRDVCCSFLEKRLCSLPLKLKKGREGCEAMCASQCVVFWCRVWRSYSRILQAVTRPGEQAPEPRVIWLVATLYKQKIRTIMVVAKQQPKKVTFFIFRDWKESQSWKIIRTKKCSLNPP